MSGGQDKYTQYSALQSDKNTLLKKIFASNAPLSALPVQMQFDPGKETQTKDAILTIAKSLLQPAHQTGDMGFFPNGVDLNFSGKSLPPPLSSPDTTEGKDVVWSRPGDPANAYTPDITSPGPGKTDGINKVVDPKIAVVDLKPNYIPGAPGTGTASPALVNPKLIASALLGQGGVLGDSGASS
jgi:hypothetical protein